MDYYQIVKRPLSSEKSVGDRETSNSYHFEVDRKVNKTIDSSKSNLNESTAYVDPQINKIKDLMSRIQR